MEKKYELTEESQEIGGILLSYKANVYRIRALRDFGDVKKGDLGGFIQKERNLSQEGDCWVYDTSMVYGNAEVRDNAKVSGDSWVFRHACISGNASVGLDSRIHGSACVTKNACVSNGCDIGGNSLMTDNAVIYNHVRIGGHVIIRGNAEISKWVTIDDYVNVSGSAKIYGGYLYNNTKISGKSVLYNVNVRGNSNISVDIELHGPVPLEDVCMTGDFAGGIKQAIFK